MPEDVDLGGLRLVGAKFSSELAGAISEPPELTRNLDGGSTLSVTVADYRRKLVTSNTIAGKAYATVTGLNFELVGVSKTGNDVKLTFEDAITVEAKRPRPKLARPASSLTRQQIAELLAREANLRITMDPEKRPVYNKAFERDDKGSSWQLMQSLASEIGWRCFSDGWQIFFGSDAWLSRLTKPLDVYEGAPFMLSDIDFDMDVAEPASTASFTVDAERWALPPGRAVRIRNLGWADGDWLVSSTSRTLTSTQTKVEVVRRGLVLAEPPPEDTGSESGEPGFIPENASATGTGGNSSNSAAERFVQAALSKKGRPYVWGASGPNSFDCSGLVQWASAQAGKTLGKPSKTQFATIKRAGKLISVDAAINTRGALLMRMTGDPTHIAISLGNGQTIEARGKAYGCGVFNARGRFTHGGTWF